MGDLCLPTLGSVSHPEESFRPTAFEQSGLVYQNWRRVPKDIYAVTLGSLEHARLLEALKFKSSLL